MTESVRLSISVFVSGNAPEFGAVKTLEVGSFVVIVIENGSEGDGEGCRGADMWIVPQICRVGEWVGRRLGRE